LSRGTSIGSTTTAPAARRSATALSKTMVTVLKSGLSGSVV
jgi:hypothetical protein